MDGQPFISMQFVDGENLASLLLRIGRPPADKAVELSRRLCAGLAAAHSQGVLHRDLKPANIMIEGRGQVLITDFGFPPSRRDSRGGIPGTGNKVDTLGRSAGSECHSQSGPGGLTGSLLFFLLFFVLRVILRKEWLAGIALVTFFVVFRGLNAAYPAVEIPTCSCGLLSLVVTIFVTDLTPELAFTTNFSAWYGSGSLILVLVVSALAISAFRKALGAIPRP